MKTPGRFEHPVAVRAPSVMVSGFRFLFVACLAGALPFAGVLAASPALADETQTNDTRLLLRIEGALPAGVTAEMIRAAIAAELSVDVALESSGLAGRGTVAVKFDGAKAVVMFTAGHAVHREIAVPKKPDQTIEIVALIVGNLARDEAGALIAELQIKIGVATGAASGSAAASTASAPPSASASAFTSAPPSASAPPPASASASASAPPPPAAPRVGAGTPCRIGDGSFGADFVPGVGFSTSERGRRATRLVSFNLVGGVAHGLAGFELAGAFNLETGFMCGAQIAGAANIVRGPVRGFQLSGGANLAGDVSGVQLTGGVNFARDGQGAQVSGGFNLVRDWKGIQLTGGLNLARAVYGMQLAPLNVAHDVTGMQLGVVNVATGYVKGVQLGVVNYADDVDVPIGVINVMRHGRTHLDFTSSESAWTGISLLHGGRRVHNIWGVGVQPAFVSGKTLPSATYGIGFRAHEAPGVTVDVDALVTSFVRFRKSAEQTMEFFTVQPELRVVFAVPVFDGASFIFGPSVRVLVTSDPETKPQGPFGGTKTHDERATIINGERNENVSSGTASYIIPGVMFGVRL